MFLAKEALPVKVSELQQLVLDTRRLLCEREQKWQAREDAHNNVKRTQAQLVQQLNDWCHRAVASGIEALALFSRRLRCYA